MAEIAMLNDVSKCIGCRACQIACKSWNGLSAEKTSQRGTYQNPSRLSADTWCLVHYTEIVDEKGDLKWLFRREQCYHCRDATCAAVCPYSAITKTKCGAVVINNDKCRGCQTCVEACPFHMPQFDGKNVKSRKCTLCYDRLQRGLLPACVQSCPSQAILFGEREGMLNTARARVKELGGNATLYGDRSIHGHVLYVLPEKPELYEGINLNPQYPLSTALIKLFARLSLLMRS